MSSYVEDLFVWFRQKRDEGVPLTIKICHLFEIM